MKSAQWKRSAEVSAVIGALLIAACGGGGNSSSGQAPPSSQAPPPPPPPKRFVDATAASGIAYEIGYKSFLPIGLNSTYVDHFATGGAAAGDYDSDGDIDLFITRGDIGPNLLYRNNGSGQFTDVAAGAGVAFTATATENYRHSGPTFADMNGNGHLDLFIGGLFGDPSFIFANNGDGTFSDVTAGSGIDAMQAKNSVSAAFGDYDLDGDLDMFVTHWGESRDPANVGDTEHLWRNDSSNGTIVFTSVSEAAGISPSILTLPDPNRMVAELPPGFDGSHADDWTFTPTFARIDDDLYPDLLIVADFNATQFFRNNGDGTFSNATAWRVLDDRNGMGSAVGDFDNDGDLDWFVTAISEADDAESGNRFYENVNGSFVNRTTALGVRTGGWGWGACFLDFDNDGNLDLYHTNGWELVAEYQSDRSVAFEGTGGGPFIERAASLGLDDTEQGRGVVCADFDNDGDIDIFQLHRGSPVAATMWRNDSTGNNYLRVKLEGLPPNTEAAGARIYLTVGQVTQMREIMIGSNFVSQNPTVQVFGLGTAAQADELRVQWPDGRETIEAVVAAGQTLNLRHPDL